MNFSSFYTPPHPEDKPFPSEISEVVEKPKDIFLLSATFHSFQHKRKAAGVWTETQWPWEAPVLYWSYSSLYGKNHLLTTCPVKKLICLSVAPEQGLTRSTASPSNTTPCWVKTLHPAVHVGVKSNALTARLSQGRSNGQTHPEQPMQCHRGGSSRDPRASCTTGVGSLQGQAAPSCSSSTPTENPGRQSWETHQCLLWWQPIKWTCWHLPGSLEVSWGWIKWSGKTEGTRGLYMRTKPWTASIYLGDTI